MQCKGTYKKMNAGTNQSSYKQIFPVNIIGTVWQVLSEQIIIIKIRARSMVEAKKIIVKISIGINHEWTMITGDVVFILSDTWKENKMNKRHTFPTFIDHARIIDGYMKDNQWGFASVHFYKVAESIGIKKNTFPGSSFLKSETAWWTQKCHINEI